MFILHNISKKLNYIAQKGIIIMDKKILKETYASHKIGILQMNIYTYQGHVPYHWHDEYELIRIVSGNCECIINGEHIFLDKNTAILIHSQELHTIAPLNSDCDLSFYAIVVHPYAIFGTDCNQFYNPKIRFKRFIDDEKTLSVIDKIINVYNEKRYGYELKMKSYIIDIFSDFYYSRSFSIKETKNSENIDEFSDIIAYIHSNYSKPIRLRDLQKIAYCSKSYIIQTFKKNTGKTPIDYINSYRLYKSVELLKDNKYNILDISLKCGFENVGYYIKKFKKEFGVTPLKHRKQNECK